MPAAAGLHERRRRQGGDVEHAALSRHPFEGPAHRLVGQLDDQAHIGARFADAHGDLEGGQLARLGAHDGRRGVEAGLDQTVSLVGAALDVGDAPALHDPGQPEIGVVVHHHDRDAVSVQLLDGAQPHALQAADDHMAVGLPTAALDHAGRPGGVSPGPAGVTGAGAIPARRAGARCAA